MTAANEQELRGLLIETARWSRVAEKNGDLHARIASALALESSAADESVGERQGRQPAQDIWRDPAAARERLAATTGQSDAKSVEPSNAATRSGFDAWAEPIRERVRVHENLMQTESGGAVWEFVRTPSGTWTCRVNGRTNFRGDSLEELLRNMGEATPICAHGQHVLGLFREIVK